MIVFLMILIAVAIVAISFFLYVEWGTHVEMSKHASQWRNLGKAWINFPNFFAKFKEREWTINKDHPGSFFTEFNMNTLSYKDEIHANMIVFDDKSYTFYPWSYVNFMFWQRFQKRKVKGMSVNKYTMLQKELKENGFGYMTVFGHSMKPIIKSGQKLRFEVREEYEVGDIVFCRVKNHYIDAHKITKKNKKKGYMISNNYNWDNGWTRTIYGKVIL